MTKRTKFDFERLKKYCDENKIKLAENYENTILDNKIVIIGYCIHENCYNLFQKKFTNLVKTNGYCFNCKKIVSNQKRNDNCLEKYGVSNITKTDEYKHKNRTKKYTFELLQKHCTENNIILLKDYKNEKLNSSYIIEGKCSTNNCLKIFTKEFYKFYNTNSYCNSCILTKAKEIRKNTNLKKFGVENLFESEDTKNKSKNTNFKKFGVEYPSQSEEIKNKIKITNLQNWGETHHSKNKIIQDKIINTNIQKYGYCHLMHNPEYVDLITNKSFKYKNYIFPSGNIIKIQGYENYALDELIIVEKINETDIITGVSNVPEIWYNSLDNKKHRHYVDIFIPSQNRCIEVKSTWTSKKDNVFLKQKAAKELGYQYELWIYEKMGKNKICYK
jgi:hypothetical protein